MDFEANPELIFGEEFCFPATTTYYPTPYAPAEIDLPADLYEHQALWGCGDQDICCLGQQAEGTALSYYVVPDYGISQPTLGRPSEPWGCGDQYPHYSGQQAEGTSWSFYVVPDYEISHPPCVIADGRFDGAQDFLSKNADITYHCQAPQASRHSLHVGFPSVQSSQESNSLYNCNASNAGSNLREMIIAERLQPIYEKQAHEKVMKAVTNTAAALDGRKLTWKKAVVAPIEKEYEHTTDNLSSEAPTKYPTEVTNALVHSASSIPETMYEAKKTIGEHYSPAISSHTSEPCSGCLVDDVVRIGSVLVPMNVSLLNQNRGLACG